MQHHHAGAIVRRFRLRDLVLVDLPEGRVRGFVTDIHRGNWGRPTVYAVQVLGQGRVVHAHADQMALVHSADLTELRERCEEAGA